MKNEDSNKRWNQREYFKMKYEMFLSMQHKEEIETN